MKMFSSDWPRAPEVIPYVVERLGLADHDAARREVDAAAAPVKAALAKGREPTEAEWAALKTAKEKATQATAQACVALQEQLLDRHIQTRGRIEATLAEIDALGRMKTRGSTIRAIDSEFWRFACPNPDGTAFNLSTLEKLSWFELCAEQVLRAFPPADALAEPEPVERYAGRPSIRSAIEAELEARAARGEMRDAITAEAKAILEWVNKNHPTAAGRPTTARTIENQIRNQFAQLKAGRTK
jgi:hypothetical protein